MPGLFDDILGVEEPKQRRVASVLPRPRFVDPFLPPEPDVLPPAPLPEPEAPPAFEPEPSGRGFLGTVGHIIDTPGRWVREAITGKDDASGRDILRTLGWENDDDEGFFTPAGLAGFGAELVADPLNLLPGFFGLKAATKAGKAAKIVGSHLDDADKAVKAASRAKTGLKKQIEAAELAGEVLDERSIAAAKAALPKARTDLFGDLLGAGEKMAPDAELVSRIAGRGDEVGKAADTLLQSGSDAFRPLSEAGDRVRAGQEALLSVGGEFDPLGLFRLGGKFNPINALPKVPGITAPLELPQKTLIEGASAAQKIQDLGRGIAELPGIRHVGALFSKVPGAPLASKEALEQFAKESQTETRAAGAMAEEGARKLDTEIKGMGEVTLKPAEIEPTQLREDVIRGPEGEILDPLTGEVLRDGPPPAQVNPLGAIPEDATQFGDTPLDPLAPALKTGVTPAATPPATTPPSVDPLGMPAGSAPAEGPRVASATDVGGAGSAPFIPTNEWQVIPENAGPFEPGLQYDVDVTTGQRLVRDPKYTLPPAPNVAQGTPKKFEKLNKAADVLAGAEAKLGVQPVDILRDVPEPQTVADLGRSEAPDILESLMKPQPPVAIRNPGVSSIGEASNPGYMREVSERADEAAARAVDAREGTRQRIIDSGGGSSTMIDRHRAQDNVARQAEQTAKTAKILAGAGENLQQAAKTSRETMEGRSVSAGRAITDALERPNAFTGPKEVVEVAKKIQKRQDEIMELERGMTPELKDARVKYTTHVPTEGGRKFFQRMAKNKSEQAKLFVALEQKRIAAGLPGDLKAAEDAALKRGENLPQDPKLRAEVLTERYLAARRAKASKGVPASVSREWQIAAAKMDPDTKKFIQENGLWEEYVSFGNDLSLTHVSQLPRMTQYKGLTVNELNEVMGEFAARAGVKGDIYNSNPAAQLFTREMRHAKLMAGKSFLEKTAEQFGKPGAEIPEIMRELADDALSPEGFRIRMGIEDPQTAKAAFDTLKRMTDEEAVGEVLGWFDKITRSWKGWITRGFPAYHVRNHISNRWQAWLTGVPLSGEHIQNGHKLVAGTDFKTIAGDGKVLDRDTLLKEMQQTGALKGGFFEENLAETLDETASKWDPLNPDNMFIRSAERVSAGLAGGLAQAVAGAPKNALKMDGNAIEAADRASVFLYWRQKGFSPRAAAEKVDQALFDYSKENLSPFEQKYLNRGVFFYGYMRNVLPFMAGAMSENGAKVAQMLKLGTQPGRPDFVPEYAAAGLQLPLGKDEEGNSKMAYSLGTPLESVAEPFAQNPLTMLNPFFKMPLEMASGRDFFLGKDIADAKKAPNWVDNSPDILQDLLGTVKTPKKTGGTRVEIDPNIAYALRNNPFSRISTTANKIFDERKDVFEDIIPGLFSGSRIVSIDDEQEKMWAAKDQAKEMLRELAREGKVKVGKYESFGRTPGAKKGEDEQIDLLLRIAQGR